MPELPEVETIKRSLKPLLTGLTITGANVRLLKIVAAPADNAAFVALLTGKKITGLSRRGKYLLFTLTAGYSLVFHLRMTGSLVYYPAAQPLEKHAHLVIELENGFHLRFMDYRQFGRVWLLATKDLAHLPGYKDLGPEPFDPVFTEAYFRKALSQKQSRIKPLLLNQTFIAGLGNIYTDEALHRAGIEPESKAASLKAPAVKRLYQSIRAVLQEGIEHRGSSVRDYFDGEGQPGNYQKLLRVYGKTGQPCPSCGTAIVRKKVGGRGTFFCPHCQRG